MVLIGGPCEEHDAIAERGDTPVAAHEPEGVAVELDERVQVGGVDPGGAELGVRGGAHRDWPASSSTIGLDRVPSSGACTSMTSPARRNTGGVRLNPMPLGVPVAMTSPGCHARACET